MKKHASKWYIRKTNHNINKGKVCKNGKNKKIYGDFWCQTAHLKHAIYV